MNTKIRSLIRQAFGFHSDEAVIGMAMLAFGGTVPHFLGARDLPTETSGGPGNSALTHRSGGSRRPGDAPDTQYGLPESVL